MIPFVAPVIAIIDDDASLRRALGRVMDSASLGYREFASAEAFLETDVSESIDCLIADMTMCGLSGLELKQQLNLCRPGLPMIILTAHDCDEMRQAAREAGVSAFFRKPVDTEALLDAIHWIVRGTSTAGAA
jgi:FixJ family two-component response regulator